MAINYETTPVLRAQSNGILGVIAGGGMSGYCGVVIHEPTSAEFYQIKNLPEVNADGPLGVRLNYDIVATVTVSGQLRWTNCVLERAPEGRQDVRDTGRIALELFDVDECREFLERCSRTLDLLGISITA
ncbi:hypothetical protein KC930_04285 [Candidatus Saccharibacteria bacterium]|nr:hypothetical protein [Candidatus Saccharibacteria bacterium]